ncbi:hypothetical protein OG413_42130 [Streptomyces sp. NBC_01433]|uniref:hypothetical protein n=1 Tax=Streptomyces sp. NBC_01433 TaxID=2903864 RepID=UPI002257AC86|nr:hypothetical protein [Streptomyces sp. NBC_01433]MCX4681805.1 hypothetical protein [Streptomyces sp. NBC_01433]
MPNTSAQLPSRPRPAETLLREGLDALAERARCGVWTPTPLERRIAGLLTVAAAGDGLLTAERVRTALWEGAVAFVQENGGELAALLADLLPVLTGHEYGADGVRHTDGLLEDAYRFVAATATGHAY